MPGRDLIDLGSRPARPVRRRPCLWARRLRHRPRRRRRRGGRRSANLASTAVYVTFWVGLTFASGLAGPLWHALNPFDTIAAGFERAGLAPARAPAATPQTTYFPAAVSLLAFLWLELVYPDGAQPRGLAVAIGTYTAFVLVMVWRRGRARLQRGEAFTALFDLLAAGAPLGRSPEGRLVLRPPFAGLARLDRARGVERVVPVVLGSTSFDGLTRTQMWADLRRLRRPGQRRPRHPRPALGGRPRVGDLPGRGTRDEPSDRRRAQAPRSSVAPSSTPWCRSPSPTRWPTTSRTSCSRARPSSPC